MHQIFLKSPLGFLKENLKQTPAFNGIILASWVLKWGQLLLKEPSLNLWGCPSISKEQTKAIAHSWKCSGICNAFQNVRNLEMMFLLESPLPSSVWWKSKWILQSGSACNCGWGQRCKIFDKVSQHCPCHLVAMGIWQIHSICVRQKRHHKQWQRQKCNLILIPQE